jgi:hypothetical protein
MLQSALPDECFAEDDGELDLEHHSRCGRIHSIQT